MWSVWFLALPFHVGESVPRWCPFRTLTGPSRTVQVLDGADSQYSGMQIGQPQDEDEETAGILPDEDADAFRTSSVGMWTSAVHCGMVWFQPDICFTLASRKRSLDSFVF